MDTPQVTAAALHAVADATGRPRRGARARPTTAAGGRWRCRDPTSYAALARRADVDRRPPAPTPGAALERGRRPGRARARAADVDTVADADLVAALAPTTRFAEAWRALRAAVAPMIEQSFSEVFASALDGAPTVVVGLGDEPMRAAGAPLEPDGRRRPTTRSLALCDGPTLDSAAARAG